MFKTILTWNCLVTSWRWRTLCGAFWPKALSIRAFTTKSSKSPLFYLNWGGWTRKTIARTFSRICCRLGLKITSKSVLDLFSKPQCHLKELKRRRSGFKTMSQTSWSSRSGHPRLPIWILQTLWYGLTFRAKSHQYKFRASSEDELTKGVGQNSSAKWSNICDSCLKVFSKCL